MSARDVRERAAFEAWQMAWAPKGDECERARIEWDKLDTPLARLTNGHVVSLEDEWEAWLARAALASPVAAPVSPDEATLTEYLSRCRPGTTREEAARDLGMTLAPVSPPAPRGEAVVWAREAFTEAALHAIGCRAAYGPDHPAAMNPSAKVREAWTALLAAERAASGPATGDEKGNNKGGSRE